MYNEKINEYFKLVEYLAIASSTCLASTAMSNKCDREFIFDEGFFLFVKTTLNPQTCKKGMFFQIFYLK